MEKKVVDLAARRAVGWLSIAVHVRRDTLTGVEFHDVTCDPLDGFWERARKSQAVVRLELVRALVRVLRALRAEMTTDRERDVFDDLVLRLIPDEDV